MRAHARRQLNCSFRNRGRLRFRWRVLVRSRARVRVRSQESPGVETTAWQWSPRRAELRAQGTVPVRIRIWLPWPHTSIRPWSGASGILLGAGAWPGKRHGELPGSMLSQSALPLDSSRVVLSDVGIRSPFGESLS